ncbi:MAG TPA: 23S rRNA (uridine(2552)-2'-O)-methyltransferase RlmE [Buchnera sp. (in: enterobacteria)]|nr:23S rRNA (uridine(2552)-2'-O)-methyltransferase RlmE [Buchnera sp. (in: enterobacteria)]
MPLLKKYKTSPIWLKRHFNDKYVKLAHKKKLRSRAYFKLEEIQKTDKIFRAGMTVIDLGAAPGSWSEYAITQIGDKGIVIACDILPISPIKNLYFIQGDCREKIIFNKLLDYVKYKDIHLIMSDMAPNMSGHSCIDLPKSLILCELAFDIMRLTLMQGGTFLVKLFQGEGFNKYLNNIRSLFSKVIIRKPKSSRSSSREVFIVAVKKKI